MHKSKKNVDGWSTEEMKDKANSRFKIHMEEIMKWRGLSQEELDQRWKNLERKIEADVLDKYKIDDRGF